MARSIRHASAAVRLFLIDDEPVVRRGIELLIGRESGFEICGQAATGSAALRQVRSLRPDIAIVDLRLQAGDGLRLITALKKRLPTMKVLVFTMHEETPFRQAANRAGADAYIAKAHGSEKLIEALHRLSSGTPVPARLRV